MLDSARAESTSGVGGGRLRALVAVNSFARRLLAPAILVVLLPGRPTAINAASPHPYSLTPADTAFLDDLERATFRYFREETSAQTGLTRDRSTPSSPCSIAAVGFGLTAYCIGAERGYVTREQARDRVLATLRSLLAMPEGPQATGVALGDGMPHPIDAGPAELSRAAYCMTKSVK